MKPVRQFWYSFISSIVATAIGAVFVLGITGIFSGRPGIITTLNVEELHRIPGHDFKYLDGENYNLGYKTSGSYLYSKLGLGVSNDGYVLIPEGSNSQYRSINDEALDFIRTFGLIKNLPEKPKMGFGVWLIGNLTLILLVMFFISTGYWLFATLKKDQAKEKKKNSLLRGKEGNDTKNSESSEEDKFRSKILLSLCYAAKADGKIEDDEIDIIIKVIDEISSLPVSKHEIIEIIEIIPEVMSEEEASKISKGLDDVQKWMIIHGCILLTVSDRDLDNTELNLTFRLGLTFGFSEKEIFERFKSFGSTDNG